MLPIVLHCTIQELDRAILPDQGLITVRIIGSVWYTIALDPWQTFPHTSLPNREVGSVYLDHVLSPWSH